MNKENEAKDLVNLINDTINTPIYNISKQELISKLRDLQISEAEFAYEDYDDSRLGFGEIEEIEQYGGEGDGSRWYSIKHFKKTNQYFRIDGYYESYNGSEFESYENCLKEVKPKEKNIIVYE